MTTAGPQTYSEIYETVNPTGRSSYWRLSHDAGRLVRISKETAELSCALGATLYRKAKGQAWLNAEVVTAG